MKAKTEICNPRLRGALAQVLVENIAELRCIFLNERFQPSKLVAPPFDRTSDTGREGSAQIGQQSGISGSSRDFADCHAHRVLLLRAAADVGDGYLEAVGYTVIEHESPCGSCESIYPDKFL